MSKQTAKKVTVTGSITEGTRKAIVDYRWANQLTLSQVIEQAVDLFVKEHGLSVVEPGEVPTGTETLDDAASAPATSPTAIPVPGKGSIKA